MKNFELYPWAFITKRINKKFREEYDAQSKEKERPFHSRTADEWCKYDEFSKKNHPFLYWLEDFLRGVECNIDRVYSFFKTPYYWYVNGWRDKTHVIPCGLKFGEWHDSSTRLFYGMMNLMVFFVEHENKSSFDYYLKEKAKKERGEENGLDSDPNNPNSGYPQHQIDSYEACLKVYNWYKVTLPAHEKKDEELHDQLNRHPKYKENPMYMFVKDDPKREEYNDKIYEKIWTLEEQIEKEKIEMMKLMCEYYGGMWS